MSKPRKPSTQRDCAFRKKEREQVKSDKATLKRQRREGNTCAMKPLTPDAVRGTKADAQQSDDQQVHCSLPSDSGSEVDGDVGAECCT